MKSGDLLSPQALVVQVVQINELASKIGKHELVFRDRGTSSLIYSCAEAGFLRTVSWLYTLYQESGDGNVEFLVEKLQNYSSIDFLFCKKHVQTILCLRTTLQHSLNLSKKRDADLKDFSEQWFRSVISMPEPLDNETWQISLIRLIQEASSFLGILHSTVKNLEDDEFCVQILLEWNEKSQRYHADHEFDPIIFMAAMELGIENIDPVKFRMKYCGQWKKELDVLNGNYDFQIEARKRVEAALLEGNIPIKLPITGRDIIEKLNIPAGPKVKEMLEMAQKIFASDKITKEELLLKLSQD